jgi:hypothetical protein
MHRDKRRKQEASERTARAQIEESNMQARAMKEMSDDQILQRSMTSPGAVFTSGGGAQFDQFERRRFG